MEAIDLSLEGVKLLQPRVHGDDRGKFLETHRASTYPAETFVQDNCSVSTKGVLRGMHFQISPPQAKLVTVLLGEIYDVVVDIRPTSPTFGKWLGVNLNGKIHAQLYIPSGFAHGFCALSDQAIVAYKMSSYYDPVAEGSFRFDDSDVGIEWPIEHPLLSERDEKAPSFREVILC